MTLSKLCVSEQLILGRPNLRLSVLACAILQKEEGICA